MIPIGLKLCQNALQMIPDVSCFDAENIKILRKKKIGAKKSNFANRLKRVLAKFEADRSHAQGVNGRSKFLTPTVAF